MNEREKQLKHIVDLLEFHLGDSDQNLPDDQDVLEDEYPVHAAMQIAVELMQAAQTSPTADDAKPVSDADINSITMNKLGLWPSFEAQSWACKVAHAVIAATAQPAKDSGDAQLLDWLRDNTCDLRCINVPTGGDDCDVRWTVVEHRMSKPHEVEIGRSFTDAPRDAIRAAIAAIASAEREGK